MGMSTESRPNEQWEIGVKGVIRDLKNGGVLLLERPTGLWELPGGRMRVGEKPDETLQRELTEELPGVGEVVVGKLVGVQATEFRLPSRSALMLFVYLAQARPADLSVSDEHLSARWTTAAQLPKMSILPEQLPFIEHVLRFPAGADVPALDTSKLSS